jgi:HPt (histidine-containing phosphotransfer) domain-containing protein
MRIIAIVNPMMPCSLGHRKWLRITQDLSPPVTSPIDPQALTALREIAPDEPAFVRDLIDVFLQATPPLLAQIDQAIGQSDAALLTRAAHTIKGSAGNFGATTLVQLASALEMQGRAGIPADAAAQIAALRTEYERVAQALRGQQ